MAYLGWGTGAQQQAFNQSQTANFLDPTQLAGQQNAFNQQLFSAQLQHCQVGPAPVLARIESSAGHGAGKPTSKRIEEVADMWAFLVKNLGGKEPPGRP